MCRQLRGQARRSQPVAGQCSSRSAIKSQTSRRRDAGDSADFKAGRRDTIAKAFERARTDPVPTQRAKPGLGHNQPPEPTPKEDVRAAPPKEKPEPKFDLKKKPVEDELPHEGRKRRREERLRGEHGHFAAQVQSPQVQPGQPQPDQRSGQAAPIANPLPSHAPYREPLARMDPKAKAEWHQAPESVRASMHRMYREFDRAAKQMREAYEAFKPIAHYHRLAQSRGTSLARALDNTTIENKFRRSDRRGRCRHQPI